MKKIYVGIILIFFSFYGFSQVLITGKLTNTDEMEQMVKLSVMESYEDVFTATTLNEIVTIPFDENGRFSYTIESLPCLDCLYRITTFKQGVFGMSIRRGSSDENFMLFNLPERGTIHIEGDADKFTMTGKVYSEDKLWSSEILSVLQSTHYNFMDSLVQVVDFNNKTKNEKEELLQIINQSKEQNQQIVRNYTDTVGNIYGKLVGWMMSDYEKKERSLPKFKKIYEYLAKEYNSHSYTEKLSKRIHDIKYVLPIGSEAPEIVLATSNGAKVNAMSVTGDLLLIDFWASWCAPCRKENKETVKPLYEKYREKGFRVYSISADTNREKWLRAMKEDGIDWISVSDLLGSNSPIYVAYKIEALPTTYLVNLKEFKILGKNLRGIDLEEFVDQYFKEK